MTGPEHYAKAEFFLGQAEQVTADPAVLAAAQVHATLALAAATALGRYNFETGFPQDDRQAWLRTASEQPAAKQRRREMELAEQREFAEEQP